MSITLWALVAVLMVAAFCLGAVTAIHWRQQPTHRWRTTLGVVYAVVGLIAVVDLAHVQATATAIAHCNQQNLAVLKTRSDARVRVDATTRDAQRALTVVLQHLAVIGSIGPDDPALTAAVRAEDAAASMREQVDAQLQVPYPDCR